MNPIKLERITEMLREQVESGQVKGASAYVLKNGRPIYRANVGMADEARGIKWTDDTIVRLYSMTKPVTAAAVMLLCDRGLLDLHDKVSWYIPTFAAQSVLTENGSAPAKSEVTIKQLMDMTSGCCYPDTSFPAGAEMQRVYDRMAQDVEAGKPWNTMTLAEEIGRQPLAFHPGEGWLYGTSADVLGAVIEKKTEKRFGEFLREELFEPLGMKDTDFYCPEDKQYRFAENYQWDEQAQTLVPCLWQHLGLTYLAKKKPAFESGGAGLCSTADDYAAFAEMLLNMGVYNGRRILSENAVRYMTSPAITAAQRQFFNWEQHTGFSYGSLMRVAVDENAAGPSTHNGEYGWDGWLGPHFANDPESGCTFLYFIQRCGGLGARPLRMMKQIVYGAED